MCVILVNDKINTNLKKNMEYFLKLGLGEIKSGSNSIFCLFFTEFLFEYG